MEYLNYSTLQLILDRIDQQVYSSLLVAEEEYTSNSTEDNQFWKSELEYILSHPLRERQVDWKLTYENISSILHNSIEDALISACSLGLVSEVSILLEVGADPSYKNNSAILSATNEDRPEIIEILLADSRVNPIVHNNSPYRIASRDGHYRVAGILESDPRVRSLLA